MSIIRINHFGFENFAVIDNGTDTEVVRFNRYTDAVEFILFFESI